MKPNQIASLVLSACGALVLMMVATACVHVALSGDVTLIAGAGNYLVGAFAIGASIIAAGLFFRIDFSDW